jgi:G3E family GTPase
MFNTKQRSQPISTVLVVGPSQSGKTRLLEGWARDCPPNERWTIIFNDANQTVMAQNSAIPVDRVHTLQLFGGCVCCASKMVLETHLSRTLRINVPDRLFIEVDSVAHINSVIESLSATKWQSWIKIESVVVVVTPRSLTLSPIEINTPLLKAIFINRIDEVPANQAEQALVRLASEHAQGVWRVVSPVVNDSSTLWPWHAAGTLIVSKDKLIKA